MFSFGAPQWIIAGYLVLVILGTPLIRLIAIRYSPDDGRYAFVSWKEFWGKWSVDASIKAALVGLLWWGGFWGI